MGRERYDQLIIELEQSMSPLDRIGQLMLVGLDGTEVSGEAAEFLEEIRPGGMMLFSGNGDSRLEELALRWSEKVPVIRSVYHTSLAAPEAPSGSASSMHSAAPSGSSGSTDSDELVDQRYEAAKRVGMELRNTGIQMAPVRASSVEEDPVLACELVAAEVRGYADAGLMSLAEQFPSAESEVPHGRRRLEEVELLPFRAAIGVGIGAIMTAHVCVPALEPDRSIPATLSYRVLTRLLRDELAFDGLIITDCMDSRFMVDNFGIAEASSRAIEAGADLILVAGDHALQKQSFEGLIRAAKTGRLSEARIGRSVRRILAAKASLGLIAARNDPGEPG